MVYDWKLPVVIYWDHTNIVKYIDFPFICGADWTKVFRFKNDIDTKFFVYWLEHFKPKTQWYRRHYSLLKDISFPLPPLATQQLIVAKLDEIFAQIDEAIATTQDNIEKTDELTKSVLDRVFEEGEWEKKRIEEISEKIQYWYTWKVVEKSDFRYLRITDIQNNQVIRDTVPFCDIDKEEAKKYMLNAWDIVFARTWATVWKSFLIDKAWIWNVFASYLIRIVIKKDKILDRFLLHFFQSNKYRNQIFADVVWAAQPNFNGNKLGQVILPLPPLAKQQEIVKYFDQVFAQSSQLKEQYQAKLLELKALKASVLQSAFEGKLI